MKNIERWVKILLALGIAFCSALLIVFTWGKVESAGKEYVIPCPYEYGCHQQAMWVAESAPEPYTKLWYTDCYNSYDNYEDRIRFCS